ncbi:MAG: hypothetical protein ABL958_12655 [Bdellovibrionia bacterium]
MKLFAKLVGVFALLASFNASADSLFQDGEILHQCGGVVQLRKSDNGDLAVKLINVNLERCNELTFWDVTSGKQVKTYPIPSNTSAFTLSQEMRSSLSGDCALTFAVRGGEPNGRWNQDTFNIIPSRLGWCSPSPVKPKVSNLSYQLSNNGNCKVMVNGDFSNRFAPSPEFCQNGIYSKSVISYEYSNKGNCKIMVDGKYSNENTDNKSLCDDRP